MQVEFMKELILALDLLDREEAVNIALDTSDFVDRIKVNYPLVLSVGIDVVKELSKINPVIADFKIADIPYISSKIAEIAFKNGASAVIVHGFVGRDTVKAVLNVAKEYSGEVYVVSELSSEGAEEFMIKHSIEIVKLAKEIGCHGVIAPATRIDRLIRIREVAEGLKVFCPGIGFQGGSLEAIKYSDGIIIGRAIYLATNPRDEAMKLKKIISDYDVRSNSL